VIKAPLGAARGQAGKQPGMWPSSEREQRRTLAHDLFHAVQGGGGWPGSWSRLRGAATLPHEHEGSHRGADYRSKAESPLRFIYILY